MVLSQTGLVGMYGPFDDGKPETVLECSIQIESALRTARELERANMEAIIIGDFNADPRRGKQSKRIDKLVCDAIVVSAMLCFTKQEELESIMLVVELYFI